MIIRPMEADDLYALDREDVDMWATNEAFADVPTIDNWIGHAFTAVDGDKPVGIAGLALLPSGVAKGWLIGSRDLRSKPMFLHRMVKRSLDHIRNHGDVKRVEITVQRTHHAAVRWAKRLGFILEASGDDFALYVMENG